jgi:polyhydroxyalkanoate synthesis regulator phasin
MKKIIYSTVGTVFLFQEKIKELLEDLIQNQHYTEEEGKRIVDEFFFEINTNVGNVKSQIELNFDKLIKKYNLEQYVKWKDNFEQLMNDWKATSLLPTKIKHYR